jgi:hypothetical protein
MEKYRVLLRDFGYRFEGRTLVERGIRGFTSDRIVGQFRDAMDAAEYLCPMIHDPEFTRRLIS